MDYCYTSFARPFFSSSHNSRSILRLAPCCRFQWLLMSKLEVALACKESLGKLFCIDQVSAVFIVVFFLTCCLNGARILTRCDTNNIHRFRVLISIWWIDFVRSTNKHKRHWIMKHFNSHAIGLGQATCCAITGQKPVFQVDYCFANQVIEADKVVVHDGHLQIFGDGDDGGQIKIPSTNKETSLATH